MKSRTKIPIIAKCKHKFKSGQKAQDNALSIDKKWEGANLTPESRGDFKKFDGFEC